MRRFYSRSCFIARAIFRILWGFKVDGRENIPPKGGVIVACNHIAALDPVMVGSIMNREINYFAKAELFENFLLRKLIETYNAIPIRRKEFDKTSIKRCIALLTAEERPLLMFPEGTRSRTGKLGKPQKGVAFLAAKAKVPVLPVYIKNSNKLGECFIFKKRIKIKIGELILHKEYEHVLESKDKYGCLAEYIIEKIQKLKNILDSE